MFALASTKLSDTADTDVPAEFSVTLTAERDVAVASNVLSSALSVAPLVSSRLVLVSVVGVQ